MTYIKILLRLPEYLYMNIKNLSEKEKRNVTQQILYILEKYIKKEG
jgi:hypothetical protein